MKVESEHLWVFLWKYAHIWNEKFWFVWVCGPDPRAAYTPYSWECEKETWLIVGWSLSSISLVAFCPPLVIHLFDWLSRLDCLTWESQWHHCPQAKARLDKWRHTSLVLTHFSLLYKLITEELCMVISFYISLKSVIVCLPQWIFHFPLCKELYNLQNICSLEKKMEIPFSPEQLLQIRDRCIMFLITSDFCLLKYCTLLPIYNFPLLQSWC